MNVYLAPVEAGVAGFKMRQRQDVLDQKGQPVGVVLDFFKEPMGDRFSIRLGIEQCLDIALDDGEGCAQLMADIGYKFLAQVLKSPELGKVVEHENGAAVAALFFTNCHAVDLQESFVEVGQHELLLHNTVFLPQPFDQLVGLVDAYGFHYGFAFWVVGQLK